MIQAPRGDIGRHLEAVTARKAYPQAGILALQGADVALNLEPYTMECRGKHAILGVRSHQGRHMGGTMTGGMGGIAVSVEVVMQMVEVRRVEIDEGKQGGMVVHRLEAELRTGADDAAGDAGIPDEVVGYARAGIDDQQSVTGDFLRRDVRHLLLKNDDGAQVIGKTVGAIPFRRIAEQARRVAIQPYKRPGLLTQGVGQRGIVMPDATYSTGIYGIYAADACEKRGPRFAFALAFDVDDFAFLAFPSRASYGKFGTSVSNVNE